jgi:hypothetical protein
MDEKMDGAAKFCLTRLFQGSEIIGVGRPFAPHVFRDCGDFELF